MSARSGKLVGLLAGALIAVSVVSGVVSGPATAQASPARYVLEKCDWELPGGGTAGATFTGSGTFTAGNECAKPGGGPLIILQGSPTTTASAYWSLPLPPPPGGSVESVTVTAEMCAGSNQDTGTVAFAVQSGWPLTCAQEVRTFELNSTAGSPGILYLGCQGTCEADPFVWATYFAATEVDPTPPVAGNLGGSLLTGGPLRGHQTLTAVATDEGGGISKVTAAVNGQRVGTPSSPTCQTTQVANSSVTGTVAITATPCPSELRPSWALDTSQAPFHQGPNTVQVCANDFATLGQPNEGCSPPQTIDVDNSCAESGVVGGERLTSQFVRSSGSTVSIAYGKGAKLRGTLTNEAGDAIPGATICVELERPDDPEGPLPLTTLTTDPSGRFFYEAAPGPNRSLLVGYRHDSFQISQTMSLRTHVRPTLQARPRRLTNGQRVNLSGRLPGPNAAGRVVVLQANVPSSHRWITFRRATTDRGGRFGAVYRFTSTTRKITYRFRALVPRQAGYPWDQGASKPTMVTVRK